MGRIPSFLAFLFRSLAIPAASFAKSLNIGNQTGSRVYLIESLSFNHSNHSKLMFCSLLV